MPAQNTITIQVKNGKISCTPLGGNVRARQLTALEWDCDEDFSLAFALLDGKDTPAWPFQHAQPPVAKRDRPFTGTLKRIEPGTEPPAYKYTITVGRHRLDPIIIVDP
jgi:hypothetical protein